MPLYYIFIAGQLAPVGWRIETAICINAEGIRHENVLVEQESINVAVETYCKAEKISFTA